VTLPPIANTRERGVYAASPPQAYWRIVSIHGTGTLKRPKGRAPGQCQHALPWI